MIYIVWKTDKELNPLNEPDRIMSGKNIMSIIKHLAYEENVHIPSHRTSILRCKNYNWIVKYNKKD